MQQTFLNSNVFTLPSSTGFHIALESTITGASGGAESFSAISAVPEPETYAMLLSGLGLLGFVARRKKHKSA